MTDLKVNWSLVREGRETPQTMEEWIATARAQILEEIHRLEDKIESLEGLFRRVEEITSFRQCTAVFQDTLAYDHYYLGDFPALAELANNYDQIKAGEY